MDESMGQPMSDRSRRHQVISSQRRRQLLSLAATLADTVEEQTKPHERCLLRRMVESLLPDEE